MRLRCKLSLRPIGSILGVEAAVVQRIIVHLDLDAFFVAVERLDNPALAGVPVIVGGRPDERGVVSSASYECRVFGVQSAMPTAQALRLCPQAILVPGHRERYAEMSRKVMSLLADYTPALEPIDPTDRGGWRGRPHRVAPRGGKR